MSMGDEMDALDRIRSFNRQWTARMGLLSRNYLGSGLSLTEARVLYELADEDGQTASEIAERLELDEGYLSRLINGFASRGWVEKRVCLVDARRRLLRLTEAGCAELGPLQRRARDDLAERLGRCSPAQLEAAARDAEGLLARTACLGADVSLRGLEAGDAGWLVQRHGELYARDEGFDHTFEALVAEILADFLRNHDPTCERGWIAANGAHRLGSIFCTRQDAETAKLRLFLVVPEARGIRLGQRLLRTCMDFARETGYRRMVLWTHESHRAACALYERTGWQLQSAEPKRSFGAEVVEQHWSYDF